jgi:hypothetical protein
MRFTDNPVEFGEFTIEMIGEDKYYELVHERNSIVKMDWEEEAARLHGIAKKRGLI